MKMRDKNTKFFHQATMQRRMNNKVLRIIGEDNNWIEEEKRVLEKFKEYFHELFKTSGERE